MALGNSDLTSGNAMHHHTTSASHPFQAVGGALGKSSPNALYGCRLQYRGENKEEKSLTQSSASLPAISSPTSTSDHDATPRSEQPPHHAVSTSSTMSTLSSPRHALIRQKTVKPSDSGENNILAASILNLGAALRATRPLAESKPSACTTFDNEGTEPRGTQVSLGAEGEEDHGRSDEAAGNERQARSEETLSRPSYWAQKANSSNLEEASSHWNTRDRQADRMPSPSSPGASESGRKVSFSTRPWLGSRTSSSTIDIPIESIVQRTDESPIDRGECASSVTSYFPDIEELQRTGVLDNQGQVTESLNATTISENLQDQKLPASQSHPEPTEPPDSKSQSRLCGETKSDKSDSSGQNPTASTESWPCSKKHGDTPFGMSRVMALANSLCLDQSRLGKDARCNDSALTESTSPIRTGLAKLQQPLSSAVDDSISPKSQMPPVLVPGKQDTLQVRNRRSAPCFERQSFSGIFPMGKQASLTASTPRSTEDALLESWGFTVSTPLCPPKCYPLSSPAIDSAPKERLCRARSSASSISACSSSLETRSAPPAPETRRVLSSSMPPSIVNAGGRSSSVAASLPSENSLGFPRGLDNDTHSDYVLERKASPSIGRHSGFRPPRPSSLRADSIDGGNPLPSQSDSRQSSRHNSEASSDHYANTTEWRRDSSATGQSSSTRASQSSGVFSMDDREQDERMLSPQNGSAHTIEDEAAHRNTSATLNGTNQLSSEDHSDDPHIVPYEGVVNIIPYEDRYVISAIMEGFTIDNITVAVKSVKNGIGKGILDDACSIQSAGSSASSRSSFTAGNRTRKTKCVHLVADRWDDGAHFERKIAFGTDADFSKGITARFDGNELQIDIQRSAHQDLWNLDRLLEGESLESPSLFAGPRSHGDRA